MTVGSEPTSAKEDGVALNLNEYNQVLKSPKAHDRSIVGVRVFQNARNRQLTLASFGHDSLKLWSIAAFEDDFSLFPLRTINPWNCGIQSFTTNSDGKKISVVSTDCSLHHIYLGDADDDQLSTPRLEIVNNGLMEIWFCLSISSMPDHFLTVNFQSIQLQILNQSGGVVKGVPFEKAKQISSIAYGSKFIAIGSSQGVIFVVNSNTLGTLYSHEGHSMKVRCLEMLDSSDEGGVDDQKGQRVLSGSDDKTIKLFALTDSKAQLERIFCGHKGIITGLAICQASGAQRFASSGADNYLILWEMESGQKLHIFANCTTTINDLPRSICFTPNGRYLLVGTEESTILAFRVPQPPNYVEEQLEETGEGEEGLVVGEEEEEVENDENRMEMDEPGEEWANQYGRQYSAEYENENDNYDAEEYRPTQSNFDQPGSVSAAEHDEGETEENEEEERGEEWQPNENDHPIGGEGEDRERQELDEELGID